MEVKPLKSYKIPTYPEKYIVLHDPNILKILPQRWKGNAKVGIALSSVLMLMLSGCGQKTAGNAGAPGTENAKEGTGMGQTNSIVTVAPIFEHGAGRGSFGCVSVAPPAFLSEAEAYEVIAEEVKREGLVLEKGGPVINGVEMPLTSLVYTSEEEGTAALKSVKGSLEPDGYDSSKSVAYEFVSKEDIIAWQDKDQGGMSTVESYDAIDTAKRLKDGLQGKSGNATVAIFYDPMGFDKEVSDKYREEFREISENEKLTEEEKDQKFQEANQRYEEELNEIKTNLLREQVKEFLEWLKAQGVI